MPGAAVGSSRGTSVVLLAWLLAAYLIFSLFYAWVLVNHDYEAEYLAIGNLAIRGQISLYQPEMTGQWMPLPFYVYGVTQVLFGPSLLPARLLSVALGGAALVLVFLLASRWGGPVAGTAAAALFCTHGLVAGYYATAHFSSLTALLHLAGIYILFCTEWRWRDVICMAVLSLLFLTKPHYWPTLPFALVFLLWRAPSFSARAAVTAAAAAVPVLFFVSDWHHIKIFAYMPIVRDWVAPLGYYSWHTLMEDPAHVWTSDYVDIGWDATPGGRLVLIARSFAFFLKRYAVWMAALAGLALLRLWQWRAGGNGRGLWGPPGLRFTFWLFWYVVAWQFVIVGPYIKQGFAYVGAVAPLLATVLGWLFATAWQGPGLPRALRAAALVGMILALVVSPWVHRQHYLPRRISPSEAAVPVLRTLAGRLAAIVPAGEKRVFLLGDPLPLHLAGRQSYLRQFHQHLMVFTSVRDQSRYIRAGMWGRAEMEEWLGDDAQYAILQESVVRFYGGRAPYRDIIARMDELLARNFTLVATLKGIGGDRFLVYRRTRAAAYAVPGTAPAPSHQTEI